MKTPILDTNEILTRLAAEGQSFRERHLKKALEDLERLEDDFLKTVKKAASSGARA